MVSSQTIILQTVSIDRSGSMSLVLYPYRVPSRRKFTTSAQSTMQCPGGCGAGYCVLQSMLVGTTSELARAHNRSEKKLLLPRFTLFSKG